MNQNIISKLSKHKALVDISNRAIELMILTLNNNQVLITGKQVDNIINNIKLLIFNNNHYNIELMILILNNNH